MGNERKSEPFYISRMMTSILVMLRDDVKILLVHVLAIDNFHAFALMSTYTLYLRLDTYPNAQVDYLGSSYIGPKFGPEQFYKNGTNQSIKQCFFRFSPSLRY